MKFDYPEGATPLDREETKGLKLPHLTTRDQLNKWGQENIASGRSEFFPRAQKNVLTEGFILRRRAILPMEQLRVSTIVWFPCILFRTAMDGMRG
jgi:hypothetical protein